MKKETWDNGPTKAFLHGWWHGDFENNQYEEATIFTPFGIVECYRQSGDPFTRFWFIAAGKIWERAFAGSCYSQRYCITLAKRFAKEKTEEPKQ